METALPEATQAIVEAVTPPLDLTPIMEAIQKLNVSVNQLMGSLDFITVLMFMLGGIALGCAIGIILAVVLK